MAIVILYLFFSYLFMLPTTKKLEDAGQNLKSWLYLIGAPIIMPIIIGYYLTKDEDLLR